MSNNRKRTRGRNIQTVACAPFIKVKDKLTGISHDVPNPEAGKIKQIKHAPIRQTNIAGLKTVAEAISAPPAG